MNSRRIANSKAGREEGSKRRKRYRSKTKDTPKTGITELALSVEWFFNELWLTLSAPLADSVWNAIGRWFQGSASEKFEAALLLG